MPLTRFKNLTTGTRLILGLGLMCLALVAVPLVMYVVESGRTLQSARLKQVGIAPSKALLRMVQLQQQHRGLSVIVLSGNTTMEAQRAAKQIEVDKAVEAFNTIMKSDITDPALTAAWRRAVGAWRGLANGVSSRSITNLESVAKHTVLIDENLKLLDLMLDHFGLLYDSTGHEYHLAMALMVHMPRLTELLGQLRARGSLYLTLKRIGLADRIALINHISNVERQYWYVERALGKAAALNPFMTAELSGIVTANRALAQQVVDLTRTQVVEAGVLSYPPAEYWAVFTQTIDDQFRLIDKGIANLEGAFQTRITALRSGQITTIGFMALVVAFAVWIGTVIVRATKQDIAALTQSEEAQRRHAGEFAVALDQLSRATAELAGHRRRWEQLYRLGLLLNQSLGLENVYPAFAHAIKVLIPYDRIAVIVSEGGKQLRVALSVAEPPLASHQGEAWSQTEGCAAQWVLDHQTPRVVQDLAIEATYRDERCLVQEAIRSTIWIPLLTGGESQWVLCLDHRMPQMYSPESLELLGPIAEQLTLVLRNDRLYEAQCRATSELTAKVEELEQTQSRLEQAQSRLIDGERLQAMGQMAVGVAHDFNNSLMGILGQTQLIRLSLETGAVAAALRGVEHYAALLECLSRQEQVALDAAETIRKIRAATRPRGAEAFGPVALSQIVEQVVAITQPRWKDQTETTGAQVLVQTVLADTPPVLGHAAELREALTNLLFNALDAMPQGGTITITTRHVSGLEIKGVSAIELGTRIPEPGTRSVSEWVELTVTDTGVGMPQAVQSRIFEPFFSTKGARGTGLGLSMVYGIISRHHGEIAVQSEEGEGTTITLLLPVAEVAAAESAPRAAPPVLSSPRRLLVIDDDPLLAETLSNLLRILGHETAIAASGEEGLMRLAAERFDLVMTDLGMPEMSGWEVAKAVKARWPKLPVILVTGWGDALEGERPGSGGVDTVLAKPYTVAQLQDVIAQCSVGPG